ncbi:hypothetical protein DFH09DRAFT_1364519 [Mycena vulgaris]|nr:hypothetical protein DFH09DRAFT_1364519 [Mycena vulgaris]
MLDIEQESAEDREAREEHTKQNELAPIACLPPEILAQCFIECIPMSIRKLHGDFSWLNVTRVSSRWRNVALACPELWSTVVCSRPTWMLVMLERSKLAPLTLRVDLNKHIGYSPERILLDYASRLGALDIRSSQYYLAPFVSGLQHADAAPRLQDIRIVNTDDDNLGEGGMWLPPNVFRRKEVVEGRRPGARVGLRLHLQSCAFPWDSGWYSQLTHLHLENIHPAQSPTMEALLAILVGSSALQTLSLIYCSPSTYQGFLVDLPNLTTFILKSDSPSICAYLLGYLILPPSAILKVTVSCNNKAEHDHDMHKTLVPRFFSPCKYDTARIIHGDRPTYLLLDSARPHWSRRFRIYASSWSTESVTDTTKAVLYHLDALRVTTLHFHGMDGVCKDMRDVIALADVWDLAGQRLRHVATLHLHRAFPTAWLEFLLTQAVWLLGVSSWKSCLYGFYPPKSRLRSADGTLSHAWPELRRLLLHGLDLGAPGAGPQPSRADMLRALLWARREGGARIPQLEIEGCENVFGEDLRHLRLFADLVYDGKGKSEALKGDAGVSLRSYSLDVFANMIEYSRALCL